MPKKKEVPRIATQTESHESGIVSPEKNKLVEEHYKKYPDGDPTVRRIHPTRDVIQEPKEKKDKAS